MLLLTIELLVEEYTYGGDCCLLILTIIIFILFLRSLLTIRGEHIILTAPTDNQGTNFGHDARKIKSLLIKFSHH